jgi:adenylate cyclase
LKFRFQPLGSRPVAALWLSTIVFAAVMALRLAGSLEVPEVRAYDRFLRLRPPRPATAVGPIVLIEITEDDIRELGHPICDDILARVVSQVLAADPRALGIDLYRDAPVPQPCGGYASDAPPPPHYTALGDAVTASDRVVMVMKFPDFDSPGTPPPAFLRGSHQVGFSDLPIDLVQDGSVRRGLLYLWSEEGAHVSFALQLALRYLRPEGIAIGPDPEDASMVRLGPTTIPPFRANDGGYVREDDGGYQFLLDYGDGPGAFPSYRLADVARGQVPDAALRDRVVILGSASISVQDHFYTPYSRAFDRAELMRGIEIHGHAVSQLIRFARGESAPLASPSEAGEALWILAWAALGSAMGLWNRSAWITALGLLGGLAALFGGTQALLRSGIWFPLVAPALAGVSGAGLASVYLGVSERTRRRQVTDLFSRFLRPAVADEIWRQREAFLGDDGAGVPRARRVTLTTLISDLKGYTDASEQMGPEGLTAWINDYLNAMAELVEQHGGVVDDYAGDGIKANFGFPVAKESEAGIAQDAVHAVRCALAMGEEIARLNAGWRARGLAEGRVRVGIFTGPATLGAIGGRHSLKYTTVGDSINVAARLETFDKDSFAAEPADSTHRILIGEETERRLGGAFRTVDLGAHTLSGKREATRIFRVLGPSEDATRLDEGGKA